MNSCLSTILKSVMRTQTSITFECLQLRRDHYLASGKALSHDAIQQLHHAPTLAATRLFPLSFLADINKINQDSLQTKALLRFSVSTRRNINDRGRVNRRGTGHQMSHFYNNQYCDYQHSSFGYRPDTTSTLRIPTATGAAATSSGGPRHLNL